MALTDEQIADLQKKAAERDEFAQRLEALDKNKDEILREKRNIKDSHDALSAQLKQQQEQNESLLGMIEKINLEREEEKVALQKERETEAARRRMSDMRTAFNNSEVYQPDHVLALFRDWLKSENGETVVDFNGKSFKPSEFRDFIKADPNFSYLFRSAAGAGGGMSSRPTQVLRPAGTEENPWVTGNITKQIYMRIENPTMAARLEAEAKEAK